LVWHLEGNPRLGPQAKKVIDDPQSSLVLPVIALAEASYIVEHGRTAIPTLADLLRSVVCDLRISIYPLNWEVFQESVKAAVLPEMHDRLIVGSALYLQSLGDAVVLLTKDTHIVASQLVSTLW
jgi:PIN domain nuclease of toxin-antitoxin system